MNSERSPSFSRIRARAEQRRGGAHALAAALLPAADANALREMPGDRVLSEMTKRVFCAGFVWKVIEAKWSGFEDAFCKFDPSLLAFAPDDYWEQLAGDKRIVRNEAKIRSVRANAHFVCFLTEKHGGAGRFFAEWPSQDNLGLLDVLAKRGSRLGGMTGQYLLRFLGRDGFILSADVLACLREAGLDISQSATSKKELVEIQKTFNKWAEETGLSLTHLSRICAMSAGENLAGNAV
jgi:3-methyladenine DNA glycosylase Tag